MYIIALMACYVFGLHYDLMDTNPTESLYFDKLLGENPLEHGSGHIFIVSDSLYICSVLTPRRPFENFCTALYKLRTTLNSNPPRWNTSLCNCISVKQQISQLMFLANGQRSPLHHNRQNLVQHIGSGPAVTEQSESTLQEV